MSDGDDRDNGFRVIDFGEVKEKEAHENWEEQLSDPLFRASVRMALYTMDMVDEVGVGFTVAYYAKHMVALLHKVSPDTFDSDIADLHTSLDLFADKLRSNTTDKGGH